MAIRQYVEITCDACGRAEYLLAPVYSAKKNAREQGWVTAQDEKLWFCDARCRRKYGHKSTGRRRCVNCIHYTNEQWEPYHVPPGCDLDNPAFKVHGADCEQFELWIDQG